MESVDWSKEIEFIGFDPYDVRPTLLSIEEEAGYVSIGIEYGAYGEYVGSEDLILESNAEYFDEICVGFVSGRPLNPFLSEDFSIINTQEE